MRLVAAVGIALTLHTHLKQVEQLQTAIKPVAISHSVQPPKVEEAVAVTPPPQPVTPTYPTSCAAYEPIVAQYSWNVRVAMAIMQAESGCNPYAVSSAYLNYDDIPDYGLFQIHGQPIYTPSANIAVAYQKYVNQGWNAWSTYKSGAIWRYY